MSGITDADQTSILTKWPTTKFDKVAGEAVALREWFRGVLARVKAEGLPAVARSDIDHLNAVLARGSTFEQVDHTAHGHWHIGGFDHLVRCRRLRGVPAQ